MSKEEAAAEEYVVDFEGPDDPYNAQNWPFGKKVTMTVLYSLCSMGTTWSSTIYSSGVVQVQHQFHVGNEVALLGMSLFLAGNAFGPLIWAPMSEAYGRKISVLLPVFGLMVFSFASAVAKDLQTLMITRFFGGVFGGAPSIVGGGAMADIWPASQRSAALLLWGMSVVNGPLIAPVVGGALVTAFPHTGWRWTGYITGIILAVTLVASIIWLDESYPPVLLARKANKLRLETRNWAIHSKSQEHGTSFGQICRKYLVVPFEMLVDPIALCMNTYAAFCYAIIYLSVSAYAFEFIEIRGWNSVVGSLPFLGMIVGVLFGGVINLWGQVYYRKQLAVTGRKVLPEARLVPMMFGSVFFPAGLFIMGWTGKKDTHWIGFCIGGACLALGFFIIFQGATNYLVDTYLMLSASALATNMFIRSILAAAFPLFARALFTNLGIDWGMSLLGFIAIAMIPIPFMFHAYGHQIRAMGKWSKQTYVP